LEQATALGAGSVWASNAAVIADDGTNRQIAVPVTGEAQFFRLRKP
jgi:VCBS repeat-containing protein